MRSKLVPQESFLTLDICSTFASNKETDMSKLTIDVHDVIAAESHSWDWEWYGYKGVFSLESVKKMLNENPGVGEIHLNFHCDGGEVEEGLAIYDALRTSGRKIFCNVEGKCHSMAVTLLLAAPRENRSANPNSLFLIHEVQGGAYGSTSAIEAAAEEQRKMQDAILDIYADRTGRDRAELEEVMKKGETHTAEEMLEMGFISSINAYNTNFKNTKMNIIERLRNLLTEAEAEEKNVATPAPTAEEGLNDKVNSLNALLEESGKANEALTKTNAELTEAANAAKAERDGIAAQLTEANAKLETSADELTQAKASIEALNAKVAELEGKLTQSNFFPGERQTNAADPSKGQAPTKEDIREKLKH